MVYRDCQISYNIDLLGIKAVYTANWLIAIPISTFYKNLKNQLYNNSMNEMFTKFVLNTGAGSVSCSFSGAFAYIYSQ